MRYTIVYQMIGKAFILVCKVLSIFCIVECFYNQLAMMLSKITMNNHSFYSFIWV